MSCTATLPGSDQLSMCRCLLTLWLSYLFLNSIDETDWSGTHKYILILLAQIHSCYRSSSMLSTSTMRTLVQ